MTPQPIGSAVPATAKPFTQELLAIVGKLEPAQATAWLGMAVKKNDLIFQLQTMELKAQGYLLSIIPPEGFDPNAKTDPAAPIQPYADQAKVQAAMDLYKAKVKEMNTLRVAFTNTIEEGIIKKLMVPEKRMDPKTNEMFLKVVAHDLSLREAAQKRINAARDLNTEIANFKAHFENEYSAIDVDYRQKVGQIIFDTYKMCLEQRTPVDAIPAAISVAKLALADVKFDIPKRFERAYIPNEQAAELFANIVKPVLGTLLAQAHADLSEKFSLYAKDLQNVAVAIKTVTEERVQEVQTQTTELRNHQAANTLFASASSLTIAPEGFKGVTELTVIKIVDDSEEWVSRIMAAFLENFNKAFVKTRNSKNSKLNLEQMAKALDAAGVKIKGVEYVDIKK